LLFNQGYIEGASTRNVGAVFNREIKCRGWPATSSVESKPLPLKFIHWQLGLLYINKFFNFDMFAAKLNIKEAQA